MKALERIKKYGLKKYLKSCRKIDMRGEDVEIYQKKFGYDLPLDKVVRYRQSLWDIKMEKDEVIWEGTMPSFLHEKPNDKRDMEEAFHLAQKEAGESGWTLICAKKIGYSKAIYHGEGTWEEKKVTKQQKLTGETLQEKRDSIALSLKKAGYSAKEVVEALNEV